MLKIKEIFVTSDEPIQVKSDSLSDDKRKLRSKIETKYLRTHECAESERLTLKWRKVFPKGTTEFSFGFDKPNCNFYILMHILKIHNRDLFHNINIYSIKIMLINFYKYYIRNPGLRAKIIRIWKDQYKTQSADKLNKGTSIESIIHDESYYLSEIDVCLLMSHMHIPIILYLNSHKQFTPISFKSPSEFNVFYFIRISNSKEKAKNKMFMNVFKNKTLFSFDELKDDEIEPIVKDSQFIDFKDYMASK